MKLATLVVVAPTAIICGIEVVDISITWCVTSWVSSQPWYQDYSPHTYRPSTEEKSVRQITSTDARYLGNYLISFMLPLGHLIILSIFLNKIIII